MPIINIRQFNIKSLKKNFSLHILFKRKFSFEIFFTVLIILGIPLNLYKNRFYDNSWTVGEWLISYAGGFVRRGLPGQVIFYLSSKLNINPIKKAITLPLPEYSAVIIIFLMIAINITVPSIDIKYKTPLSLPSDACVNIYGKINPIPPINPAKKKRTRNLTKIIFLKSKSNTSSVVLDAFFFVFFNKFLKVVIKNILSVDHQWTNNYVCLN